MLHIRPYKCSDAETILAWCKDEDTFRKWTSDRYPSYPIAPEDMNRKYITHNGDCIQSDNFYPMTAFDESGIAGHFIMRYTDDAKTALRFGFVIVDDAKRGKGYGKEMISLALKFAFEIYNAQKVTIGAFENNQPAYRCYKAAGFQDVPGGESFCDVFGQQSKVLEMEMTRDAYFAHHP